MNSPVFTIKKSSLASVLIPILSFLFGDFTLFIITSIILGASTAYWFLKQSKQNTGEEDESNIINSDRNDSIQPDNVEMNDCLDVGSPDSSSESEIRDPFTCSTEEDSEFDGWDCSGEACRRTDCSDGSISDEESLIEIELFGGNYKDNYYKDEEEINKLCRRKKSPDSVLWWPEMNEEENMIEIDLSVGSIKCSRIEIKA